MNISRSAPAQWLLATCALLLLAGCVSSPVIRSDFDPGADFSRYRTWGYYEPLAMEKEGYATITSQRIRSAVRREMEQRGYVYDQVSPDLRVNMQTSIEDRVNVHPGFYDPFYGGGFGYYGYRPWGWYGGGYMYGQPYVYTYREGTVVIDVVDAAQDRLVWTGSASASLRGNKTPQERAADTDYAVQQIFTQYPYGVATAPVQQGSPQPASQQQPAPMQPVQ